MNTPTSLTIAGSDTGGGAGIQADIKTMSALGVYASSVITALTAQNTYEVRDIYSVSPEFVRTQIETVFDDIDIDSVKIGMLGTPALIQVVADTLRAVGAKNIVLDPVMVSKSGDALLQKSAVDVLRCVLVPMADVITPNLPEASVLLNTSEPTCLDSMKDMSCQLLELGAKSVLLKGGHLNRKVIYDVFNNGTEIVVLESQKIDTKNTHGTGCTMSSAVASFVARGDTWIDACKNAKEYINTAVKEADTLSIGRGHGPVKHFYMWW